MRLHARFPAGRMKEEPMQVSRRLIAFAGFVACIVLFASTVSAAQADPMPVRKVTVSAVGTVETSPDQVAISAGVVSDGATAMQALKDNSDKMTKMVAEMKAEGIAAKDLQTANFSVRPIYVTPKGEDTPVLKGYRVENTVHMTLHDIAKLGTVLDRLVALGANEIDSIDFGLADPSSAEDEARKQAMQKAKAKAELYAEAAGAELGPVISISEDESEFTPYAAPGAAAAAMRASVPIESGAATTTVRLHVVWSLK
jgi:uncharacterized protein